MYKPTSLFFSPKFGAVRKNTEHDCNCLHQLGSQLEECAGQRECTSVYVYVCVCVVNSRASDVVLGSSLPPPNPLLLLTLPIFPLLSILCPLHPPPFPSPPPPPTASLPPPASQYIIPQTLLLLSTDLCVYAGLENAPTLRKMATQASKQTSLDSEIPVNEFLRAHLRHLCRPSVIQFGAL